MQTNKQPKRWSERGHGNRNPTYSKPPPAERCKPQHTLEAIWVLQNTSSTALVIPTPRQQRGLLPMDAATCNRRNPAPSSSPRLPAHLHFHYYMGNEFGDRRILSTERLTQSLPKAGQTPADSQIRTNSTSISADVALVLPPTQINILIMLPRSTAIEVFYFARPTNQSAKYC